MTLRIARLISFRTSNRKILENDRKKMHSKFAPYVWLFSKFRQIYLIIWIANNSSWRRKHTIKVYPSQAIKKNCFPQSKQQHRFWLLQPHFFFPLKVSKIGQITHRIARLISFRTSYRKIIWTTTKTRNRNSRLMTFLRIVCNQGQVFEATFMSAKNKTYIFLTKCFLPCTAIFKPPIFWRGGLSKDKTRWNSEWATPVLLDDQQMRFHTSTFTQNAPKAKKKKKKRKHHCCCFRFFLQIQLSDARTFHHQHHYPCLKKTNKS